MEKILSDKIFFNSDDNFDIYLDGFDNDSILTKNSSKQLVGKISSLLTTSKTRGQGLQAFNKLLDHTAGIDEFKEKLNTWTALILKTANEHDLQYNYTIIWQILTKIAIRYHRNSDMCKEFVMQILPKIYELVKLTPAKGAGASLYCLYTCLKLFSCHQGASKEILENFLNSLLATPNEHISLFSGKCLHLLQLTKNTKNTAAKDQWVIYQRQLLGSLHSLFNTMFANITENCGDTYTIQGELLTSKLEISDDPLERYATLYYTSRNLIQYLVIALRDPLPLKKSINAKQILNVINRGVSVTFVHLQKNPIGDNILLSLLLPKLHIHLMNLLDSIIVILNGHLKPYSSLILDILLNQLKWTSSNTNTQDECRTSIIALRMQTYNTLSLWCETMNYGSRCDLIVETVIGEIFNDLTIEMNGLKQISINKSNNNRNVTVNKIEMKREKTEMLSIAALLCLQKMLLTASNVMRPTTIQLIQTNITQIAINMFGSFLQKPDENRYGWQCRLEIYKTLHLILVISHHLGQPSIEIAVDILKNAICRERNATVRNHCYTLLLDFEKIIHPTNNSLLFPTEVRNVCHNVFNMKDCNIREKPMELEMLNEEHLEESMEEFLNEPIDKEDKEEEEEEGEKCCHPNVNIVTLENSKKGEETMETDEVIWSNSKTTNVLSFSNGSPLSTSTTTTTTTTTTSNHNDNNEFIKNYDKDTKNETSPLSDTDSDLIQPKRKKLLDEHIPNTTITTPTTTPKPTSTLTIASATTKVNNPSNTDACNRSYDEMLADIEAEFVNELNVI